MGQSNPGGTHYQDLLREYERNLYNARLIAKPESNWLLPQNIDWNNIYFVIIYMYAYISIG